MANDSGGPQRTKLGVEAFMALAAVAWADGELDAEEADGLVRAGLDEGLDLDELARLEVVTKQPRSLADIDCSGLNAEDRHFVFGLAAWLARLDGTVTLDEVAALHVLGKKLEISKRKQHEIGKLTLDIAALSKSERPARYDLAALRRLIGSKLKP